MKVSEKKTLNYSFIYYFLEKLIIMLQKFKKICNESKN